MQTIPKDQSIASTIKTITKVKPNFFKATINDASFKKMVKAWKDLDLANGKFEFREKMELTTDATGKLTTITLKSYRGDMNDFHFMDTFMSVTKVFNPTMKTQDEEKLILEMGLMGGDDDPKIGKIRETFTKGAVIRCIRQRSDISLDFGCIFIPRS